MGGEPSNPRGVGAIAGCMCPDISSLIDRYEDEGLDGLIDKRLSQISHRRAPVDEVMRLVDHYRNRHRGWNVKHYYAWYKR